VKILSEVPYTGHPFPPAAVQHRTRQSGAKPAVRCGTHGDASRRGWRPDRRLSARANAVPAWSSKPARPIRGCMIIHDHL